MLRSVAARLESPRMPVALALLAVLLGAPSLGSGLQTDDHLLLDAIEQGAPLFGLFRVENARFAEAQAHGVFTWWSTPGLDVAFFRPLAELSHRLDRMLFADFAAPMHLENVLLYALLVWLSAVVFRTLLPARVAGIAALLFLLNDTHAHSVGWISARNTLLAACFATATLLTHLRSAGSRGARLSSPLLLALALVSGEAGVTALAYLAAHTLLIARGPLRARLLPLIPHAVVALAWATFYVAGGYGAHGGGWYRDPTSAPLQTLLAGLADLPIWLFSQLGVSLVSIATTLPSGPPQLVLVGLLIPILVLLLPVVRGEHASRFFALAMLLAIIPLFTTVPQDRMLIGASLGSCGLIACALSTIPRCASRFRRVALRTFGVLHLPLSALLFMGALGAFANIDDASRALASALPSEPDRDVIMLNSPLQLLPLYARTIRRRSGGASPTSLHQLHAGEASLAVRRVDAHTLELTATPGWCQRPIERIFTDATWAPPVNEAQRFGPLEVTVLQVDAARLPTTVQFRFAEPLESQRYAFLIWDDNRPATWLPPAPGDTVRLPALSLRRALSP